MHAVQRDDERGSPEPVGRIRAGVPSRNVEGAREMIVVRVRRRRDGGVSRDSPWRRMERRARDSSLPPRPAPRRDSRFRPAGNRNAWCERDRRATTAPGRGPCPCCTSTSGVVRPPFPCGPTRSPPENGYPSSTSSSPGSKNGAPPADTRPLGTPRRIIASALMGRSISASASHSTMPPSFGESRSHTAGRPLLAARPGQFACT